MRAEIVYEDRDLLVIWKPAGIATQTAKVGQADAVSELKNYLAAAGENRPYLGIVHRLDQPVEGLLVFAKNQKMAAALTRQLGGLGNENLMNKQYYAVICGKPPCSEGTLVDFLRKSPDGKAVVADGMPETAGKEKYQKAVLHYRLLQTVKVSKGTVPFKSASSESASSESASAESVSFEPASAGCASPESALSERISHGLVFPEKEISLVDVRIDTGRFHQIRAQLAHAGMPLLGDLKYGNGDSRICGEVLGVKSVALCAYRITLTHPATGKRMDFERKPKMGAFILFDYK
ncbi:MAG: RluA family pseudouridine synthase [bacterium]|nr:RluA family pseudouridine synthase [bacterium]